MLKNFLLWSLHMCVMLRMGDVAPPKLVSLGSQTGEDPPARGTPRLRAARDQVRAVFQRSHCVVAAPIEN